MKLLTGYYCSDASDAALVLVRGKRVKDELPVVLAGVWEKNGCDTKGQARNLGDILLEWFEEQGMPVCAQKDAGKSIKAMGKAYLKWYESQGRSQLDGGLDGGKAAWSILVSVGDECFYAWNGDAEIHLLNVCFNRLNERKLSRYTEGMQLEYAGMEPGVGVLLGTKGFGACLQEKKLKECLAVSSMEYNEQLGRHLKEAVNAVVEKGAMHPTVVLVVTKEE